MEMAKGIKGSKTIKKIKQNNWAYNLKIKKLCFLFGKLA